MAVDWLRDSCTCRAIFQEGFDQGYTERYPQDRDDVRLACRRGRLRFLGEQWLGFPTFQVREKIEAISEESKLEELVEKLTDQRRKITTWDELLSTR